MPMFHFSKPLPKNSLATWPVLWLSALFTMLVLSGCGGIPKVVREGAERIPGTIEKATEHVAFYQKQLDSVRTRDAFYKTVERNDREEDWQGYLTNATDILNEARTQYDAQMRPWLKANKPEHEGQVLTLTLKIKRDIKQARDMAKAPYDRFMALKATAGKMDMILRESLGQADTIQNGIAGLENGPYAKAMTDFPDSKKSIQNRFAPFSKLKTDTARRVEDLQEIYARHEAGEPADYGAFRDMADGLEQDAAGFAANKKKLETDLGQLYQSYTKVLQDMKIQYYVTVSRESWDENSDYYNPRTVSFTREISPGTYEAIEASAPDTIASVQAGYPRPRFVNNIGDTWSRLNLKPAEQWPSGHNAAEYWIDNMSMMYFHKYLLEENGETRETPWKKVNPSYYGKNLENLGMAVLSKPYGVFEADVLSQAAPPGMAYVGNPQYGEWKKDENGNDFWSWYGKWAFFSNLFFMTPSYYSYNTWRHWDTDYKSRKPYYGKNKKGQKIYGTYGSHIKKSPRYQGTTFAKTGGFKTPPASVRGAGTAVRSGGPRGKGK